MIYIKPWQVGIDEVGRGAWAGPMVAAAVMFPTKPIVPRKIHLRDSKLLTENARLRAFDYICRNAIYIIGYVDPETIDENGVHHANKNLIISCISSFLKKYNSHYKHNNNMLASKELTFYIDGNRIADLPVKHIYQPHGDYLYKIISCASIVAKVYRDSYMKDISRRYPKYGFESHVGYGTRRHQEALAIHGPCDIHRMSYSPLKSYPQSSKK